MRRAGLRSPRSGIGEQSHSDFNRVDVTPGRHFAALIEYPADGLDEADYYKWMRGKTPDHYSTCVAIERVLHNGLPRWPQKKLRR